MLPATNRGLSGFLRVNSSATRRASSAAVLFSSNTYSCEPELLERDRRAVERVGLDDVGAGFEVGAMDVFDDLGLGEHQGFGAVLDAELVAGEPLAPDIFFAELIGVDERTHRPVKDHDPARQDLFEPLADVSVSSRRHRLWITR